MQRKCDRCALLTATVQLQQQASMCSPQESPGYRYRRSVEMGSTGKVVQ
jgi:hypothetical protein